MFGRKQKLIKSLDSQLHIRIAMDKINYEAFRQLQEDNQKLREENKQLRKQYNGLRYKYNSLYGKQATLDTVYACNECEFRTNSSNLANNHAFTSLHTFKTFSA